MWAPVRRSRIAPDLSRPPARRPHPQRTRLRPNSPPDRQPRPAVPSLRCPPSQRPPPPAPGPPRLAPGRPAIAAASPTAHRAQPHSLDCRRRRSTAAAARGSRALTPRMEGGEVDAGPIPDAEGVVEALRADGTLERLHTLAMERLEQDVRCRCCRWRALPLPPAHVPWRYRPCRLLQARPPRPAPALHLARIPSPPRPCRRSCGGRWRRRCGTAARGGTTPTTGASSPPACRRSWREWRDGAAWARRPGARGECRGGCCCSGGRACGARCGAR